MKFTENDKSYLNKLRTNYPNRNIPLNNEVEKIVSKMRSNGSEKIVGDLVIRTYEGMLELELI